MVARATGTAWLCDGKGRIVEVLRDDLNVSLGIGPGEPLGTIVAPSDAERLLEFLAELRESDAVFDRELHVIYADKLTPFHFAGAVSDDYFIVMASLDRLAIERFGAEMTGDLPKTEDDLVEDMARLIEGLEALVDTRGGARERALLELARDIGIRLAGRKPG